MHKKKHTKCTYIGHFPVYLFEYNAPLFFLGVCLYGTIIFFSGAKTGKLKECFFYTPFGAAAVSSSAAASAQIEKETSNTTAPLRP